ncbi:OmpP1/FadL family transporter [Thalassorhabdomicrobium marinisediminis]|uniref:OmpP1/FadL family transporter n=1 Tax=Thalassorhabdomicrobium marinisediminis TaxID=2170577 RepID=UPI002493BB08|nr:outer membrane protein transport protein [Thalassorhabdomicrobium marinisediminis]
MKNIMTAGAALLMTTSMAHAVELDRSGQDISVIFAETGLGGSYAELSYGSIMPNLSGQDAAGVGGARTGNVANDYTTFGIGFKHQYTDQFSAALILDQPYGADIAYDPAGSGGSALFGGTIADLESEAVSAIGRYEMGNGFSVHGGLRMQTISGDVTLDGAAYRGLAGYNVSLSEDTAYGYLVGGAYERPDIALRVALTYFSEIEHSFETTEDVRGVPAFGPSANTDVTTPQAVNLDFQTGVAPGTLVFGSVRWADYDVVKVSPSGFAGATSGGSLTNTETGFSYTLGVGRQVTDNFAASLSVGYEPEGDGDTSPLAPTNGNYSVSLGGAYTLDNGLEISGGVRYVKLGDATLGSGPTTTSFEDNDAVAVGLKIAMSF